MHKHIQRATEASGSDAGPGVGWDFCSIYAILCTLLHMFKLRLIEFH